LAGLTTVLSDTAMKLKRPSGRRTLAVHSSATVQRIPRDGRYFDTL
jgi:hypothetical protein